MAEKCTFCEKVHFFAKWASADLKKEPTYLGFGAPAPEGPILAEKCTFPHFLRPLGQATFGSRSSDRNGLPYAGPRRGGAGSIPLHGRSPSLPTHRRTRQWG